jgi:hypothetical protein
MARRAMNTDWTFEEYGAEAPTVTPRPMSLRARSARLFATCVQGVWLLLAATPVIVVLCALKG